MELIRENIYNSFIYQDRYKYYLTGLGNTIIMAFFACLIGVILGLILSLVIDYNEKTGKLYLLSAFARMYIGIIRGTPALLQLMILYYIIFKSVNINIVVVGIISFGLNSGAYVSQIIKSGLISIPKGQEEASTMLGFNYFQTMKYVIMPQALRNVLPALGNEFITLVKETSVGAYIGIVELTKASDIIASRTYDYFFPLILIALIYLIITYTLSRIVSLMEKRLYVRS